MLQPAVRLTAQTHISVSFRSARFRVQIHTERLLIQPFKKSDLKDCILLYSDKEIIKYFDHGKPRNADEVANLVAERGDAYFCEGKPFGLFSIFHKESGAFVGQIDLMPSERSNILEIGFILCKQYHNQGFCSEAVRAIVFDYIPLLNDRYFSGYKLHISELIATVHPKNQASKQILQKIGMILYKIGERFGQPRLWYSMRIDAINKKTKVAANG